MKTIAVVSVARSDYGIYQPVLRALHAAPDFRPVLLVSGMHLSPEFGNTVEQIEQDGYEIGARIAMLLSSDTPDGIAKSMGLGVSGFAQVFTSFRPDLLMVLGDRFEMFAAVIAALPFTIPIAHLHGGELSQGAMDESIRHAITKLSHLHFTATETYRQRLIQMGEEPWRVIVSGAPALDNLNTPSPVTQAELEQLLGLPLDPSPLVVTFHPVTLEYEQTASHIQELLAAIDTAGMPVVFTFPNADTSGRTIKAAIQDYAHTHPGARVVANLGSAAYFALLNYARAMVGNSSSGIIEAASFLLPVVNVGDRQLGRLHAANVIDCGYPRSEILRAIRQAVSPEFRDSLIGLKNPYGDGHAAERILAALRQVPWGRKLVFKPFYDLPG